MGKSDTKVLVVTTHSFGNW